MLEKRYNQGGSHWLFATLLCVFILCIFLTVISLSNKADHDPGHPTSGLTPSVSNIAVCDNNPGHATGIPCIGSNPTIILAESNYLGTTGGNTIYITGTVTDNDTMDEFDNSGTDALAYYVTSGSIMECDPTSQSDRTCYSRDNQAGVRCAFSSYNSTDIAVNFSCEVPLWFNAQASTGWTAAIRAKDGTALTGFGQLTGNFIVATTTAIAVPNDIGFTSSGGVVPLGGTSDDSLISVYNVGNTVADYKVYATDMTCSAGGTSIDASTRLKYSSTSGTSFGSMNAFYESFASSTFVNADLSIATATTTPSQGAVYVKLDVPNAGIGGVCQGAIIFTSQDG